MNDYVQRNKAIIVYPSINYTGGVERVMVEVLKFLAKDGFKIDVICSEIDQSLESLCENIRRLPLKKSKNTFLDIWQRIQWMKDAHQIANQLKTPHSKIISAPCALFSADLVMAGSCHLAAQATRLKHGAFKWLFNPKHWFYILSEAILFLKGSPKILVPSQRTKSEITFFYGAAKERVHIVPHGVDLRNFFPSTASKSGLANSLGIDQDATILLTVTNEIKRKGCLEVLDALKLIHGDTSKFHYVVIGKDNPTELLTKAKALGLSSQVSALPAANREQLTRAYQGSDLFLLPTEYESFGLVGIEALACGLPVLCTKVGGLEDYISDGVDGIFVARNKTSITQGLKQFFSLSPEDRSRMKIMAHEKAQHYKWENVLKPLPAFLLSKK
ncbi:glycosyltransferase family 4 protein [Polynucleobacter sp. 71A-WALBACH]|uniref:glycosyltransferase family 4 protein n=1 Tax=Polynucleobacter sp. 71A-WALBACH TaxID=2689097 RepID=UPI001C0AE0DD|nr:glycosyltransferase family 4 protein [Polynucleobacter sp. 71A-WALBACH]MBU3593261.1 glycosyltransferase family 4 protein [Polynucleobacter sp. 71A-WALBACH]